jgi:hypothetical protein
MRSISPRILKFIPLTGQKLGEEQNEALGGLNLAGLPQKNSTDPLDPPDILPNPAKTISPDAERYCEMRMQRLR